MQTTTPPRSVQTNHCTSRHGCKPPFRSDAWKQFTRLRTRRHGGGLGPIWYLCPFARLPQARGQEPLTWGQSEAKCPSCVAYWCAQGSPLHAHMRPPCTCTNARMHKHTHAPPPHTHIQLPSRTHTRLQGPSQVHHHMHPPLHMCTYTCYPPSHTDMHTHSHARMPPLTCTLHGWHAFKKVIVAEHLTKKEATSSQARASNAYFSTLATSCA